MLARGDGGRAHGRPAVDRKYRRCRRLTFNLEHDVHAFANPGRSTRSPDGDRVRMVIRKGLHGVVDAHFTLRNGGSERWPWSRTSRTWPTRQFMQSAEMMEVIIRAAPVGRRTPNPSHPYARVPTSPASRSRRGSAATRAVAVLENTTPYAVIVEIHNQAVNESSVASPTTRSRRLSRGRPRAMHRCRCPAGRGVGLRRCRHRVTPPTCRTGWRSSRYGGVAAS
jgi:hypothetical protein